jgi:hypothetical protein
VLVHPHQRGVGRNQPAQLTAGAEFDCLCFARTRQPIPVRLVVRLALHLRPPTGPGRTALHAVLRRVIALLQRC